MVMVNIAFIEDPVRRSKILGSRNYLAKNLERERSRKREYYWNNRDKVKAYQSARRLKRKEYRAKYHVEYPWKKHYNSAKQRCNNPKTDSYISYGAKGIKFLLTYRDIEHLYYRDNADLMDSPSIDRIDPKGNYTLENCRFIELQENSLLEGRANGKPILQCDLSGNVIKEWSGIKTAAKKLNICPNGIRSCAKGKTKTCGGFVWFYSENKEVLNG